MGYPHTGTSSVRLRICTGFPIIALRLADCIYIYVIEIKALTASRTYHIIDAAECQYFFKPSPGSEQTGMHIFLKTGYFNHTIFAVHCLL